MKKVFVLCAIAMGMMSAVSCGNKTTAVEESTESVSIEAVDTATNISDTTDVSTPVAEAAPVEEEAAPAEAEEEETVDLRSAVVGLWDEDGCRDGEIFRGNCWEFKSNGKYRSIYSSEATWESETGKWKLNGNKIILDGKNSGLTVDENGPIDENGHQMKRMHSLPVPEDQIYDQTNCEEPGI